MSADLPVVFLVEDEETFIEALEIGLKREGFRVHVARDGAEALAMFEGVKADIVLLDVMLPKFRAQMCVARFARKAKFPSSWCRPRVPRLTLWLGLKLVPTTTS